MRNRLINMFRLLWDIWNNIMVWGNQIINTCYDILENQPAKICGSNCFRPSGILEINYAKEAWGNVSLLCYPSAGWLSNKPGPNWMLGEEPAKERLSLETVWILMGIWRKALQKKIPKCNPLGEVVAKQLRISLTFPLFLPTHTTQSRMSVKRLGRILEAVFCLHSLTCYFFQVFAYKVAASSSCSINITLIPKKHWKGALETPSSISDLFVLSFHFRKEQWIATVIRVLCDFLHSSFCDQLKRDLQTASRIPTNILL